MRANFSAEYFAFFTIFAQNPVACAELPHSCLPLDSSAFQPITPRFPSMQKRSPPHTLQVRPNPGVPLKGHRPRLDSVQPW